MKPTLFVIVSFVCFVLQAAAQTDTLRSDSLPGKPQRIIRATRISTPINIDGNFEDEVYQRVDPIVGLIQQDPNEGEQASEDTDLWIMFDDKNIYFAGKCYDSH